MTDPGHDHPEGCTCEVLPGCGGAWTWDASTCRVHTYYPGRSRAHWAARTYLPQDRPYRRTAWTPGGYRG